MSEVLDPPVDHPVAAALDALNAALDELADTDPWLLTGSELLESLAGVHRLSCRTDAVLHALAREVDARGAALEAGAPSTGAWLRGRLRMHPGQAKRLVATARSLHDDAAGPLVHHVDPESAECARGGRAALRAAFATGDISGEHASVATEALASLPPTVDAETARQAEAYLVEQACLHDPKALARLGKHLRHVLDPDRGDALAHENELERSRQALEVRVRNDGSSDVSGHLGPELTASFLSQLQPLAAPRPAADGVKDLRTVGQRNADALADLLRIAAGASGAPTRHGSRPTVTITMALETLERRLGAPAAMLDWSGPIPAEAARRLACDACVIPVVLDANGEPLDVGRASYPVTTAIWRALVARDGGCAFAGCDRPPEWTEAHHRKHWADGGETSAENCCLLCDHHHRAVHHHGWAVELRDGAIWTIPPPWVDPTQTPRRNTGWADLAALASFDQSPDTS